MLQHDASSLCGAVREGIMGHEMLYHQASEDVSDDGDAPLLVSYSQKYRHASLRARGDMYKYAFQHRDACIHAYIHACMHAYIDACMHALLTNPKP